MTHTIKVSYFFLSDASKKLPEIIVGITLRHVQIFSGHKPVSDHDRNAVDWTFTQKRMDLFHGEPSDNGTVDLKNLISKP